MNYPATKKIFIFISLFLLIIIAQSFTQQRGGGKDKDSGLKVLPKNISEEELHTLMKEYSRSLGVKCNHCHAPLKDDPSKLDFGSDAKPEKTIARKMILMTNSINKKYIGKMGEDFNPVACVTCHMGKTIPIASVDSLKIN